MHIQKVLKKGFTIIEMIVVIAIIATVTTLVLFSNAKLNSAVLVSNTAYEIGLIVRESQVAGLGVKASNDAQGAVAFSSSQGVHFDIQDPTKVVLFSDTNKNGIYDIGESTQDYSISNKRAGTILGICTMSLLNLGGYCVSGNQNLTFLSTADIVFTRPNPEAFFMTRSVANTNPAAYVGALIVNVGFAGDICRSVIIQKTGAVQVDSSYCPPIQ